MTDDLMEPVLERIDDALTGLTGAVTLRWGTVTSADPLRVRLDADPDPLPFKPATAVPDLAEGERVLCALQHRRVTVVNVAGRTYLTKDALREVGPLNFSGTAAERTLQEARFGDLWYDTDGDQLVWKGASDGAWRRLSGRASVSAGAWATTAGGNAGRTVSWTLPTVIEDTETIAISPRAVGSGFGDFSLNGVGASSGGVTVISTRHTQLMSTATNGGSISWWIVDEGVT